MKSIQLACQGIFFARKSFLFVLFALLTACAAPIYAPVEDRNARSRDVITADSYTVQKGDTLYSIAWRIGTDYQSLAKLNNIASSYVIYPGQKLRTSGSAATASTSSSRSNRANTPRVRSPNRSNTVTSTVATKNLSWQWPSAGPVLSKFRANSAANRGLDIAGAQGDKVLAAAGGKVVYSGNQLVGYGNLIIIKHNDQYLSAYGHNDRLLVQEGDTVAAGQLIAALGSSGASRVKLHFEIRLKGKPIDPLSLLPRRS